MTDEDTGRPMPTARITATSSFEDNEQALETLVELKEIDFGDVFTSRDTELDADEERGISIFFYHDEIPNYLNLHTGPDSELRISLALVGDNVSDAARIINQILTHIDLISNDLIMIRDEFERAYQSLDLPIEEDAELHVIGVRIKHEGVDYVIQEGEDSDTSVTMTKEPAEELEESVPDEFIIADVNRLSQFMEEEV
jgi:hypothetical protein